MNLKGYLSEYNKTDISTANNGILLLMLYDGAIDFVNTARTMILEGDMEGKGTYISKAISVITELIDTLDMEVGGEIAVNLERLYLYMNKQLLKANLKNDAILLDEVILLLTTLREGWNEVISNQRSKQRVERKKMVVCANRI